MSIKGGDGVCVCVCTCVPVGGLIHTSSSQARWSQMRRALGVLGGGVVVLEVKATRDGIG